MIVGDGLLARAFAPRYASDAAVTIFASGVSNSQETEPAQFARERALLASELANASRLLVYFGSCAAGGSEEPPTPYIRHKQAMEALVTGSGHGLVLRLPQVVGPTRNPNTLTNFLHDRIAAGARFVAWAGAERSLIDIDDIAAIGSRMIDEGARPRPLSIAPFRSLSMREIVAIFERVLGRTANAEWMERGAPLHIDAVDAQRIAADIGIDLRDGYAERVIRKYYADRNPS